MLWWWATDYAQDGCLSKCDYEDIAIAMDWDGDSRELVDALVVSGFLDQKEEGLFIHDWYDYAGKLIERRAEDAERKRNERLKKDKKRTSNVNPKDVQRTSDGHTPDVLRNSTVPIPNHISSSASDAPAHDDFPESNYPDPINQEVAATSETNENFYTAHERVFGFACNPLQATKLAAYIDEDSMEEAVVIRALERAALNGTSYKFTLITKILNDYADAGAKTLRAAEALDNDFESRRQNKQIHTDRSKSSSGRGRDSPHKRKPIPVVERKDGHKALSEEEMEAIIRKAKGGQKLGVQVGT